MFGCRGGSVTALQEARPKGSRAVQARSRASRLMVGETSVVWVGVVALTLLGWACAPVAQRPVHDPGPLYEGVPAITAFTVECDVELARWRFEVTTDAWTGGGTVTLARDAGSLEAHPIASRSAADDGAEEGPVLPHELPPEAISGEHRHRADQRGRKARGELGEAKNHERQRHEPVEQGRLVVEKGAEYAARLAKAAGTTLGGLKPAKRAAAG